MSECVEVCCFGMSVQPGIRKAGEETNNKEKSNLIITSHKQNISLLHIRVTFFVKE